VDDIPWLPTSVDTPFERFDIWRQFIIYASAWLTVCTVLDGVHPPALVANPAHVLVINAAAAGRIGFAQRFIGSSKFLFSWNGPRGIAPSRASSTATTLVPISPCLPLWLSLWPSGLFPKRTCGA